MKKSSKALKGYSFDICRHQDIEPYINSLAEFRIKYFREFPYLYYGSMEYEKDYLKGYLENLLTRFVIVKHNNEIVAIGTAIPLKGNFSINDDPVENFSKNGLLAWQYAYIGEVIVAEEHRGNMLATKVMKMLEDESRNMGFSGVCFLNVLRDNHPLTPPDYKCPDELWIKMGWVKTDIKTRYKWPTIQAKGKSKEEEHELNYWIKSIEH